MDLETLRNTPPWDWPEEAAELLLDTLANEKASESDRLVATELASELVVMSDELADALMAIAINGAEPLELRTRAVIGLGPVLEEADLGEFDEPDDVPITESTFHTIQELLRKLYLDESLPHELRRRILEAAVRAPQDWHPTAIKSAYLSGDQDWMLTAVFAMRFVRGFDTQILEALKSADPAIHYEAVNAAGAWQLEAAWPHVLALVEGPLTPKALRVSAIEAAGSIHPREAQEILGELTADRDEEIADAATDAIEMAAGMIEAGNDSTDEKGDWIN